jgi:hypothetical protein
LPHRATFAKLPWTVDFLLECIGFPPNQDMSDLAARARRDGEPVAWRGPHGEHLRLALGGGLELRMDREQGASHWSLSPYFEASQRLRVALESLRYPDDSPYDVLIAGWANPPYRANPDGTPNDSYPLCALLTDARKLPRTLPRGHVIAVALAGFALDVSWLGPDSGRGAAITPIGGADAPGGCVDVSLRIENVRELANPVTGARVQLLEVATPGRPLPFFASSWQLQVDDLPQPQPGWRIEGSFLLCGRIAGGLGGPESRAGRAFG